MTETKLQKARRYWQLMRASRINMPDEIEHLRRDAARYRWLRTSDRSVYDRFTSAALDIAIDVDMAVTKGNNE